MGLFLEASRRVYGHEYYRRKNTNDRNNDEQLNKCKTFRFSLFHTKKITPDGVSRGAPQYRDAGHQAGVA